MRMTKAAKTILQTVSAIVVIAIVALFFQREFARNWAQLSALRFNFHLSFFALAVLCLVLSYLLTTYTWQYGVNQFARLRRFTFTESMGMVNTVQLTKYIPGKVWGYAMQLLLIDRHSFSMSVVLYVNILLALTSVFIGLLFGGFYMILGSHLLPWFLPVSATAALSLVYLFFILFNSRFFALVIRVFMAIFRRKIEISELELRKILRVQALVLVQNIVVGLSAIAGCGALGFAISQSLGFCIVLGFIFADTVGYLVFIVPGGIGVREGLLYLLLKEQGGQSLALVLPIALRVLSMAVDAVLGAVGLAFLMKYVRRDAV
jgi:glycosyltransferase 2 family protein